MKNLIPRKELFGNPSRFQPEISPDGEFLTWLAPRDGVLNVWLAPVADLGAAEPLTAVTKRPIAMQGWTYRPGLVWYIGDDAGNENWRIFTVDVETKAVRSLTPLSGIQAQFLRASPDRPDTILVGLNDRDARWHDVWSVDLESGARTLLLENKDEFSNYLFDWDLQPRLIRKQRLREGGAMLYRYVEGRIEPILEIPQDDALTTWPSFFSKTGDAWFMVSSIGRDTAAYFRVDTATNQQTLLTEHPKADIGGGIWNPVTREVDAATATHLRQEWLVINEAVRPDLQLLQRRLEGFEFAVIDQSQDNARWLVLAHDAAQPAIYYLYDRPAGTVTELFSARPELKHYRLAPMHGHVIKARDGLDLVSYLTLPADVESAKPLEPLPMVLIVHGGPWARDGYGYRGDHQWLADRGYAVLSVNYRASAGFGKTFLNAGDREHAGKMHDDLIDAVEWAVREGIARRDKVAIMGASYGSYATLVGLTFTPDVFCCGVSIVGISNLVTMLQTIPPYWATFADQMYRRYADPNTQEGRAWLMARSPLTRVDKISRPLLIGHGANDVRCKLAESDQIVAAMQARNLPVTYVVYPDEGHGFVRPENRLSFNAIVEAFLAEHLGGTVEPVSDDFAGASLEVRAGADEVRGLSEALAPRTTG
jgi:dipeptidyl aminopeptidase/acylaminoacyl peptidase